MLSASNVEQDVMRSVIASPRVAVATECQLLDLCVGLCVAVANCVAQNEARNVNLKNLPNS